MGLQLVLDPACHDALRTVEVVCSCCSLQLPQHERHRPELPTEKIMVSLGLPGPSCTLTA